MARASANHKRKAVDDSDDDILEEIVIAAPTLRPRPNRRPLDELQPAVTQNKRRRIVDCVLIPKHASRADFARPRSAKSSAQPLHSAASFLQIAQDSVFEENQETSSWPTQSSGLFSGPAQDTQVTQVRGTDDGNRMRLSNANEPEDSLLSHLGRPKRAVSLRCYVPQPLPDEESEDELVRATAVPRRRSQAREEARSESSDFKADFGGLGSNSEEDSPEMASDDTESAGSAEDTSDGGASFAKRKSQSLSSKKAAVPKRRSAPEKAKEKATSKKMGNLLFRNQGQAKGLDQSLPPLLDIGDIFTDITERALQLGLQNALDQFGDRPLRVATMCSGTETPILALQMIQDALKSRSEKVLSIEHAFSAEIVPFKQAYIERNFNPPLIFRDITELTDAVNDEVPMATTAYGAKAQVPTGIHLLIAGTSCVDFSRLNQHRKSLTDGGESDKTWHAVLAYCKAFLPAVVLLENVKSAQWDSMLKAYDDIGYETAGVLADSKDFYIPQTRQRGYMVCFDKRRLPRAKAHSVGEEWKSLMGKFKRYASSPPSSFLLPSDRVPARERDRTDDLKREVDWSQCEISQMQYRQDKRLGFFRSFTHWQESGGLKVPENGSSSWFHGQVERVLDTLDVALLRKALPRNGMYDSRFKTRIWDLSQNSYRNEDTAPFGIAGCITPSGQFFLSDACRQLAPEETLTLQGLPLDRISLTTEFASELQDLAGNAMTSTVVGSAICAALIAGHGVIDEFQVSSLEEQKALSRTQETEFLSGSMTTKALSSGSEQIDAAPLVATAARAMRRCQCEGSIGLAEKPIQACIYCGHTTCISCGGNPAHKYHQWQEFSKGRVSSQVFEAQIRSKLPLRVSFSDIKDLASSANVEENESDLNKAYFDLATSAAAATFCWSHYRRTHCLTVTYQAPSARLELVLDDYGAEWRLFALAPKHLACSDWLRQTLTFPVARSVVTQSLFGDTWKWRLPSVIDAKVTIKGHGTKVPTWWCRNEMPDFRDHWQWECFTIKLNDSNDCGNFERPIEGTYKYLPQCGTACDSLYKRIDAATDETPLFLFLDPSRTGEPNQDKFVFSSTTSRLEYDEIRLTVACISNTWLPWDQNDSHSSATVTTNKWAELTGNGLLQPMSTHLEIQKTRDIVSVVRQCNEYATLMKCTVPDTCFGGQGQMIIRPDDGRFFSSYVWVFEGMRRHLASDEWQPFENATITSTCHDCAPTRPSLKWSLGEDGKSITPYEDIESAGVYERAIKNRPEAMAVQVHSANSMRIEIGINLMSLAHRAQSRLPHTSEQATYMWKLTTNATSTSKFSFRPFRLQAAKDVDPYSGNLEISIELFPKQRHALAWMIRQEAENGPPFVLEESEEAWLPKIGWRAEMRAQKTISVRGGICADHPGFGKTITSLALIQSQFLESKPSVVRRDLEQRQTGSAIGLLPTSATLIVCPRVLLKQWQTEIDEKLRYKGGVITISTTADLGKYNLANFENAKIILVARSVLGTDAYAERLAAFAAVPGPATAKGRAFSQWLEFAQGQVPEHLGILLESGQKQLCEHIGKKYKANINRNEFKTFVPSRRQRGKDFAAAASDQRKTQSLTMKAAPVSVDTSTVGSPLFEMFYFNRIIIDEFHQHDAREYAAITALKAEKRWGLSATPALGDFYDIAQMAGLLGVPLRAGSDARGVMKVKNIRELRKEMTDVERFIAMQQGQSDSLHSRIHEIDQIFLNTFVRQNIMDFAELEYEDHLVPVTLDLDHRAIYTELSQHLNSLDMRIKKGSRSKKTDREERLYEAVEDSDRAEDALSKMAAYFEPGEADSNAQETGLDPLIKTREQGVQSCLQKLRPAIDVAKEKEGELFDSWKKSRIDGDLLGDQETISALRSACVATKPTSKNHTAATSSDKYDDEADEYEGDDDGGVTGGRNAQSKRINTSKVNTIVSRLLVSIRSLRFLKNVRLVQQTAVSQKQALQKCDDPECCPAGSHGDKSAVSAYCGHRICEACHERKEKAHATRCPAQGCTASMQYHHLLWSNQMGDLPHPTHTAHGAKIEAAMNLLEKINRKGDQAILFVQYEIQLKQVEQALNARGIAAEVVKDSKSAGQQIADFRDSADPSNGKKKKMKKKTVIVLNASDETAAGSNLQNANHVLFLSPLLRDTQYGYESTMAQAIGRVRRHGQQKGIVVYRILALDTIDVDILEHRERRADALTEQGAPAVFPPPAARELVTHEDEPKPERTQLVRDPQGGKFSLRPQSWLVGCGAEDDAGEREKVKGKSRVGGWEDFSSLVKFSRAYTEDDD